MARGISYTGLRHHYTSHTPSTLGWSWYSCLGEKNQSPVQHSYPRNNTVCRPALGSSPGSAGGYGLVVRVGRLVIQTPGFSSWLCHCLGVPFQSVCLILFVSVSVSAERKGVTPPSVGRKRSTFRFQKGTIFPLFRIFFKSFCPTFSFSPSSPFLSSLSPPFPIFS